MISWVHESGDFKLQFPGEKNKAHQEIAYFWGTALNLGGLHGIGGDTTAGMLSRFPYEVVPQKPAIVIFMGGTNDLWWDLELNLIQANLSAMVSQAKYHGIAPVIGLPLPIWIEKAKAQEWAPPAKGYEHLSAQINILAEILKVTA